MRNIFTVVFLSVALVFGASSTNAQQEPVRPDIAPGSWQQDPNYKPPSTSATDDNLPEWMQYKGIAADTADLRVPHRSDQEILIWAQEAAAEALTMNYQDYPQRMEEVGKYFTDYAYNQYEAYIQETKLIERIRNGGYIMNAVASGDAFIHKKQPVEGAFRWLLEIPLIISFFQEDSMGNLQPDVRMTGEIKLILQLGRIPDMNDTDGVKIETWSVRTARKPNN